MSVPVAYATMMIIWSTTPLGIAWSNETLSPIAAVTLRMVAAALIGWALLRVLKIEIKWHREARKTYAYSLLGVYGAMFCVYTSAKYIPSGLISVLFALAPLLSNLFSVKLLGQGSFTRSRALAFAISFCGLAFICLDGEMGHEDAWIGILLLLVSVSLYSLSGVLVQKVSYHGHPLSITVGTLVMSAPLFIGTWFFVDGSLPTINWDSRSPWSVLYLATFGSLLGFAAYFYVVRKVGAVSVAMVTLVTPVFALVLGSLLNGEPITNQMMIGTACVLGGLIMYYQNSFSAIPVESESNA